MRRLTFCLLVGVAASALVTSAGARPDRPGAPRSEARSQLATIEPALAHRLAASAPNDTIQAIVVLDAQAPLAARPFARRALRLASVVRSLERTAEKAQRPVLRLLRQRRHQGRVARIVPLWVLNGVFVVAKPEVIRELAARPEVSALRANDTVRAPAPIVATSASPESNVSYVRAPELWNLGHRGAGVVVANVDTGVDVSHPDLASSWRGGTNSWFDPNREHPITPTDVNGHGTQTMGVMVGGEAGGTAIGVAPGATWIAVKIFDDHGTATTAGIHQGFQWLLDPDGDPGTPDAPNVVNSSWVLASGGCDLEFQPDLRALRSAGILPVFAAGNQPASSFSPANNPEALAVGGTDNFGALGSWSSRGPSACDGSTYPRIVGPGTDIVSTDRFGSYSSNSGTSLAAPHVSGVLALLLDAFPGLSADRQQSALEKGAKDLGTTGADNSFGYGRVDALGAYNWLMTAPDFTLAASPASRTTSAGNSVSYTVSTGLINGFAGDVDLALEGLSASQGTWSFSPTAVVGGSGSSELTIATSPALAPGSYPLVLRATSGGLRRSAYLRLVVPAPQDFTLQALPGSAQAPVGGDVSYSVSVGSVNGFANSVALTLAGISDSEGTWSFSPASIDGGSGTSQLTIRSSRLSVGSHTLTVVGASAGITHSASIELVATTAPDFSLLVGSSTSVVVAGRTASYTVSLSAVGGFLGAVELSVAGLPPGARATFLPSPVFPGVPSTLAVETSRSARPGGYTLTITGKSGSLVRTGIVGLTVKASGPSARRIAHYQARARARQQARLLALRARRK